MKILLAIAVVVIPFTAKADDRNESLRQQYELEDLQSSNGELQQKLDEQRSQFSNYAKQQREQQRENDENAKRESNLQYLDNLLAESNQSKLIIDEAAIQRLAGLARKNDELARQSDLVFVRDTNKDYLSWIKEHGVPSLSEQLRYQSNRRHLYLVELAARQGNSDAQAELGNAMAYSTDLANNYPQAIRWLTKSAKSGNSDAQTILEKVEAANSAVDRQAIKRTLNPSRGP